MTSACHPIPSSKPTLSSSGMEYKSLAEVLVPEERKDIVVWVSDRLQSIKHLLLSMDSKTPVDSSLDLSESSESSGASAPVGGHSPPSRSRGEPLGIGRDRHRIGRDRGLSLIAIIFELGYVSFGVLHFSCFFHGLRKRLCSSGSISKNQWEELCLLGIRYAD